jgi:FAD:protein FMN transferase
MTAATTLNLFIAGILGLGNPKPPERHEFHESHMGTKVRIVLYAPNLQSAESASKAAFARIAAIEAVLSDYSETSEISRVSALNDRAPNLPQKISADLQAVLTVALEISTASDGAFDVTIGPLSSLWRATRKSKKLPDAATLATAKALVDYRHLKLDAKSHTLTISKAGMRLDFGGIGKGFAADEALKVLKLQGISSALVALSGDIAVSQPPPGQVGWTVDIAPLTAGESSPRLVLSDAAVSTSGDLFQFVDIGDVRYSHVLDPKTGLGLTGFRSVTVIAPSATVADGFSKAASLMDPKRVIELMDRRDGLAVYAARKDTWDGAITTFESKRFAQFQTK